MLFKGNLKEEVGGGEGGTNSAKPHRTNRIIKNTAQNNVSKPQTTLKLPDDLQIPQTSWFCKTTILQLKIKMCT